MKRYLFLALMMFGMNVTAQNVVDSEVGRNYESVDGDARHARIYTLNNGLKVYLMINNDQPRIQTAIAVRTGGKNDPAETTGLAHYLEHIMFKGTPHFGTTDYEAEKPLLDKIEVLYEQYRQTVDPQMRADIYHQIDSISYEASKIAIANEYDKLMAGIGSSGSNAFTSEDETVYIENIPANELENWAIVQSDRFKNMVIRGFHTELEAVYEEYNRSLTQDIRKVLESVNQMLYPNHAYGKQTVIGNPNHLKNPSITNIKDYFHNYYHPSNVAICMSGNLSFDKTMDIIEQYFGDWAVNTSMETPEWPKEGPLKGIQTKEIFGHESEMITLAWRMPGKRDTQSELCEIIGKILYNNQAGLFDIDINQQQKVLQSFVYVDDMSDYTTLLALAYPKDGQTLDEVKAIMLSEIDKLIKGEFDQNLLTAIINNMKRDEMKAMEDNQSCALEFVDAFINNKPWKNEVEKIGRLNKVTKQDVMTFAKEYLSTENYVCVYKHQGEDPNEMKIEKPKISPIEMNRDKQSTFVDSVLKLNVDPIMPEYADFENDVKTYGLKNGNTLMYKQNTKNSLFTMQYVIETGSKADKYLPYAIEYFDYLGTKNKSIDKLKSELYSLACDVSFGVNEDQTFITIRGLAENQIKAMNILEDWIRNVKVDDEIYTSFVDNVMKSREVAKSEQSSCMSRLTAYCTYGPVNEYTNIPSESELRTIKPADLIQKIKDLSNYRQFVLYYGPTSMRQITDDIEKIHKTAKDPIRAKADNHYVPQLVEENEVYVANYSSKAINMAMYSNNGQPFSIDLLPKTRLFNEYFGGGMNTVVFQEMRESRGLAYQASAYYETPEWKSDPFTFSTFVISQNDKMSDCIDVFHEIIENMPLSENAFSLAKKNLKKHIEVQRHVGFQLLSYVRQSKKLGLDHDINEDIYRGVSLLRMRDLEKFSKENVAGRKYRYIILGDVNELDMDKLKSLGTVHILTLEDIFGY